MTLLSNTPPPLTLAVMAGGKSSRMGENKSFVQIGGKPMVEHVLERLTGLGDETILIANQPEPYAYLGLPTYADIYTEHGPLAGIYTAVFHANHPHVLIVATDMPHLNRSLLQYMISLRNEADLIVPRWQKFPEPLHAIYSKTCLPAIKEKLEARQLKITAFFGRVNVRFIERAEIERFDSDGRSFANINTPDELRDAERLQRSKDVDSEENWSI